MLTLVSAAVVVLPALAMAMAMGLGSELVFCVAITVVSEGLRSYNEAWVSCQFKNGEL